MKQFIPLTELTDHEYQYLTMWRGRKQYNLTADLSVGECIELLIAFSYNLHFEFSDGRFFNNILINGESVIAWDGIAPQNELIDILWHEARTALLKRMRSVSTFSEEVSEKPHA